MKLLRLTIFLSYFISIISLLIIHYVVVESYFPTKTYPAHVHKTIFIDRDFDEDEVIYISDAALEWTTATNHMIDFDIVIMPSKTKYINKEDIVIIKVNPDFPDIIVLDSINKNTTLGLYNDHGPIQTIELVSGRIADKYYKSVVLHELGHALGLKHNEGLNGIDTLMYPTIDLGADHITLDDLRNFCKLYHCNANKL